MRKSPNSTKIKQVWLVKKPLIDKVERPKVTWVPKQTKIFFCMYVLQPKERKELGI